MKRPAWLALAVFAVSGFLLLYRTGLHPPPPLRYPPATTQILFEGKELAGWAQWSDGGDRFELSQPQWELRGRSLIARPGAGDVVTRKQFGDCRLHLDFLVPKRTGGSGVTGNAGIFVNGRYLIQICDSTGDKKAVPSGCGAIRGIRAPDRQACSSPGAWQNLDVVFKAARFQKGKKVASARITVTLNGITVHDNVEIRTESGDGMAETGDDGPLLGPLRLQAKSQPVQFANVWVEPLSPEELVFYFPDTKPETGNPWEDMDYGPFLSASIEAPWPARNIAYKGIAIPLNKIYGAERNEAVIFDTDLLRYSVGWKGNFINFTGIVFDGTHQTHPSIGGEPFFANPVGPGWARRGSFQDPRRLPWGPLPKNWAHYEGLYLYRNRVIFSYTVGSTSVLEMPGLEFDGSDHSAFVREINLAPSAEPLILQVAAHPEKKPRILSQSDLRPVSYAGKAGKHIAVIGGDKTVTAAGVVGAPENAEWIVSDEGGIRLKIPALQERIGFKVLIWGGASTDFPCFIKILQSSSPPVELEQFTRGGAPRWRQKLATRGRLGKEDGPYAKDIISWPADNPWKSWLRFGGFDFLGEGTRAAICTWNGDVWIVSGIDPKLQHLSWQRVATGLFQPLGLKVVRGQIYVLGRDQITILHDLNGDGEADFYQNFNNDHQVTEHFHEFAMDLQTNGRGEFYYMKGGRHALDSLVPQHGTLIRVSPDGSRSEILANGFRAPNGLLITPDGEFVSSDQQGHWIPANRINLIKPGGFYGYMWSYHQREVPKTSERPLAWIHPSIDRSPSSFVWVDSNRWGPFQNRILALSYGMGKLGLVLREDLDGVVQGGVTRFPLDFETGIIRGLFHPGDGQLYVCGLFGWSGNKTQPGGFYRIRYTGRPLHMPSGLRVARDGVVITFTTPLDPETATDAGNYHTQVWNYRWSEEYGSPDFRLNGEKGRDQLRVESVTLSADRKSVFLKIPALVPVEQMHVELNLRAVQGEAIRTFVHHTVHRLGSKSGLELLGDAWSSAAPRVEPALKNESEGLILEIRSVAGRLVQPDARASRLVALFVSENDPPSPFVPPGQFRSRWRGFLKLKLNEEVRFHAEGKGRVHLRIEGKEIPWSGGTGEILDGSVTQPVALHKGLNRIDVDYTSPTSGEAIFRLQWSSIERLAEPIPPTVLVHEGDDEGLQDGLSIRRGRELFAQHRCASCHRPETPFDAETMAEFTAPAPSLDGIGDRMKTEWLERWVLDPRRLQAESKMPRLLRGDIASQRQQAADIARFLADLKSPHGSSGGSSQRLDNPSLSGRGQELFASLGCEGCHRLGRQSQSESLLPLDHVQKKWKPAALAAYLLEPEAHDPWSRMPNFRLSRTEALALTAYLHRARGREDRESIENPAGSRAQGGQLVAELGCLNCHAIQGMATRLKAPSLRELRRKGVTGGCLSPSASSIPNVPDFKLDDEQREQLRLFLHNHPDSLRWHDRSEFARREVEKLQCRACHEIDLKPARWSPPVPRAQEETIHLKIPPLTWVGEKLRPQWTELLLGGRLSSQIRPHLTVRMPAFPAYAKGLAYGLSQQHGFAPDESERPPVDRQQAAVGRRLIEKNMLGCIDCHAVGPRRALAGADTETINFDQISRRLRYSFYWRFMRNPQQILPGTMMPSFLEGDRSTLSTVYAGDARRQADALWNFMRNLEKER